MPVMYPVAFASARSWAVPVGWFTMSLGPWPVPSPANVIVPSVTARIASPEVPRRISTPLSRGAEHAPANGAWEYSFLRSRANSIEGGTTDILKNIIAERVLGLPRMR